MLFSLKWLTDYIDVKMDTTEFSRRLTMAGFPVEQWIDIPETVVLAKVLSAEKHPNADKLRLCRVDDGSGEELQIVCGAPNARAGMTAALARIGTELPGEFKIKKSKIRGEVSLGMLCSGIELGINEDHEGILEFDGGKPGTPLGQAIGYPAFDLEMPTNRGDCMSHLGMARELGALTGRPVTLPEVRVTESGEETSRFMSVSVEDKEDCPLYCGRLVRNVTVGPSPEWLRIRLEAAGQRSINNVVDITNFVLMETGQPLHAFDFDKMPTPKIHVRRAKPGERILTLDGVRRNLTPETLVITDGDVPIATAGIMGGGESEVSDDTKNIFLEAAVFNPAVVFRGTRQLRLNTEASMRFRRGVDPKGTAWAINRAAQLLQELAGGEPAPGIVHAGDLNPSNPSKVTLRPERVNLLLGENLSDEEIASRLEAFSFGITRPADEPWRVAPPSYRRDIREECDLVEEVARHMGYDAIGTRKFNASAVDASVQPEEEARRDAARILQGFGYHEVVTRALGDPEDTRALGIPGELVEASSVRIPDPPSKEESALRISGAPAMLRVLSHNLRHGYPETRVFELGRTFVRGEGPLPDETEWVFLGAVGGTFDPSRERAVRTYTLEDLKGIIEELLHAFQIDGAEWRVYTGNNGYPPGAVELVVGGESLGYVWEPPDPVKEAWEIKRPAFAGQVRFAPLTRRRDPIRYRPAPRFPAVKRDVALVVPASITQAQVRGWILSELGVKGKDAPRVRAELFDYYTGKHIPEGHVGLGFSLIFQSETRTLKDDEVDGAVDGVIVALGKHGVQLRDA